MFALSWSEATFSHQEMLSIQRVSVWPCGRLDGSLAMSHHQYPRPRLLASRLGAASRWVVFL